MLMNEMEDRSSVGSS